MVRGISGYNGYTQTCAQTINRQDLSMASEHLKREFCHPEAKFPKLAAIGKVGIVAMAIAAGAKAIKSIKGSNLGLNIREIGNSLPAQAVKGVLVKSARALKP